MRTAVHLLGVCLLAAHSAAAQTVEPPRVVGGGGALRDGRAEFVLDLTRPLVEGDGELVVIAGTLDLSALITRRGAQVIVSPGAFRLSAGSTTVRVMLRHGEQFSALGTVSLQVPHAGGFTRMSAVPNIDVNSNGEVANGASPPPTGAAHPHRQDVSLGASLRSSHERPGFTLESQSNVVGASREPLALRFAQRGTRAPLVDLSNYLLSLRLPSARLDLGNIALGNNRHLISGFSSRGVSVTAGPAWAQLSVGSVAGAPIVGWDNVLGVAESQHRVSAASLGLDLVRKRPGALQLRFSALDGSLQPRPGFTQGAVTDAEASRGGGVEVSAATPSQRARFAAGYTVSTFSNPARDDQLTGGLAVKRSVPNRRAARYAETTLGIVQGAKLFSHVSTQLTVGVRHERVDPLFRSVGAFAQADREQNSLDLNGGIDAMSWQLSLQRARDNLAAIASVLTSHTEGTSVNTNWPVATLIRATKSAKWWPMLSVSYQQSHQFAAGVPASNDFRPQDLANQLSTSLSSNASWQANGWRVNVRDGRSLQDNRQGGRERADFNGANDNLSIGRAVSSRLDASLDAGLELQRNKELVQVNRVRRIGGTANWQVTRLTTLATNVSAAVSRTPPSTHNVTNMEMRVELSQRVRLFGQGTGAKTGQGFLRFSRTSVTSVPFLTASNVPPRLTTQMQWTLNTGASLHLW